MLLAMDTATRSIGLAIYDGIRVLHESIWSSANRHTVALSEMIQSSLEQTGLTLDQIEALAIATGPGSYTGLRIGTALAKGLALARHLPIKGIPTFEIIAAAQPIDAERRLAAVLEAGRGRYAVGWFAVEGEHWMPSGDPELLTVDELKDAVNSPTVLAGDLTDDIRSALSRKRVNALLVSPAHSLRRPAFLAEVAWARWQAGDVDDPTALAPFYLQTDQNIPQ
jgi:tRNA threonylcarbamoyladenosine biosynthesis protein TsaB